MTHTAFAAMAAALLLPISCAAFATDSATPSKAAVSASAAPAHPARKAKAESPDDIICKSVPEPGSRIGSERACMTRGDWAQQGDTAREALMGSHPGDGMPK
jgi:hypothetical protein